jgi:hypothetical protein
VPKRLRQVLKFQLSLIAAQDPTNHRVREALPEETVDG